MGEIVIYTQAQPLAVKEYRGERVITFKDMDALHQRPDGTAGRNFRANRSRFIEGEDFFRVCADEIRRHKIMELSPKTHEDVVLLTKMGYLMLVKSFTDDLAWVVQRQLVKSYFEAQVAAPPPVRMLPENGKPLPRMRTIPKAVEEVKRQDSETHISTGILRRWLKEGKIPSAKTGKNFLVNMDDLEVFLSGR